MTVKFSQSPVPLPSSVTRSAGRLLRIPPVRRQTFYRPDLVTISRQMIPEDRRPGMTPLISGGKRSGAPELAPTLQNITALLQCITSQLQNICTIVMKGSTQVRTVKQT